MAVYRVRHFAKAAEMCNVTQPTLSSMIQKLEDELGVKIFDRSAQPVTPTAVGKSIIEQSWKVLARTRRIREMVEEEKRSLTGTFRIGMLPTVAPYLLPRFLPQIMEDHPLLKLVISEMKTNDIKHALVRGELDAAIVVSLDNMEHFVRTPLFFEQFMVYVSRGSRLFGMKSVRAADLSGESLWLLDEGHCFRDQLVRFCDIKGAGADNMIHSLGSMETFMRLVENGRGVTFIPELALPQLTDRQRELVRPFALPIPVREVVMLTMKTSVRHSLITLLTDSIRACVPQNMLKLNNTEQRI